MTDVEQRGRARELDAARSEFHSQRLRVRQLVAGLSRTRFEVSPTASVIRAIASQGHFSTYDAELNWSARLVVGHLGDSARIFADRIHRVLKEVEPVLADFVTDEQDRIDRYLAAVPSDLVEELEVAQDSVEAALGDIHPAELSRVARHEVDGLLVLGDIVAFLPDHQRDHGDQLSLLAGPPRP